METESLRARIRDAVVLLENYRSYGPMVGDGIEAFKRIDQCVAEPTDEGVAEAKRLLETLNREIGSYQGYVPTVASALQALTEWFKDR